MSMLAMFQDRERVFLGELKLIIQNAASAWSRSRLPPPSLDEMFRAIEGIYRIHKQLSIQTLELDPLAEDVPTSIGLLLMPLIQTPYSRYINTLGQGYDSLPGVFDNTDLPNIMAALNASLIDRSSSHPLHHLSSLGSRIFEWCGITDAGIVPPSPPFALDSLFLIPLIRLFEITKMCLSIVDNCKASMSHDQLKELKEAASLFQRLSYLGVKSRYRMILPEGPRQDSDDILNMTIQEVEQLLRTDLVKDLFTLAPKKCHLQINPPNVKFKRSIKKMAFAQIRIVLRDARGGHFNHPVLQVLNGVIILLDDLFMMCDVSNNNGWTLLFPPLAGKHLKVVQVLRYSIVLDVMNKVQIRLDSVVDAVGWQSRFEIAATFVPVEGAGQQNQPTLLPMNPGTVRVDNRDTVISQRSSSLSTESMMNLHKTCSWTSTTSSTDWQPDTSTFDSPLNEPSRTIVTAQMRCKCYLQQTYQQWKNLGASRIKLFVSYPGNRKQLVVESEKGKREPPLVSTIVLTDCVTRMGKTGVAIELSDEGKRTGIVYLLQLKNEDTASGLYIELLKGTDRE